ncbi:MAG: serpin family protein [Planctomycetes bacterium]|nr:serpin family protein [Planctomycetota bacterium]
MLSLPLLVVAFAFASPQEPAPPPPAAVVDVSPAVRATNELGIALFRALDQERAGKSVFVSPFAIASALAMLAEGARDETAAELRAALHLPASTPLAELHAAFRTLTARFAEGGGNSDPALAQQVLELREQLEAARREFEKFHESERDVAKAEAAAERGDALAYQINALLPRLDRYELCVANSVWADRAFPLRTAFVSVLAQYHGPGTATTLDLAKDSAAAAERINAWFAQHTGGQIRNMVAPDRLGAGTALVMASAVYFRGQWRTPFSLRHTQDEDFVLANGERVGARLMHYAAPLKVGYAAFTGAGEAFPTPELVPADVAKRPPTYPDDDGFTLVELPYKGDELAMVVLVPRSASGLARLEGRLDASALASWLTHREIRKVDIAMLRFELRSEASLRPSLQRLGVRRVFAGDAQLGGISDAAGLVLPAIDHTAAVKITELGTEAVAGIGSYASRFGGYGGLMVPFIPVFRADRPFLFLVRDVKSGAILFLGRVTDPRT